MQDRKGEVMTSRTMFIATSVILIEFMRGFTISFAGLMTLKRIFFRETKKFFCFSICGGVIFSSVFFVRFFVFDNFLIDLTGWLECYTFLVVLFGWLLLTNRSADSFLSTALAVVFGKGIISNFELIVYACTKIIVPDYLNITWLDFLNYAIIYILSVGFVFLLQKLAANKECEPLSVWNMILLAGFVSVVAILIQSYFTLSEDIFDVNPNAIIPVFVTFLLVVVDVILSVRSSQARYYSRINRLNEEYMAAQAKHFEKVRESDTEMRRLRHDMKNHVLCMNELYRQEKHKELGEYLKQLSDTITDIQSAVRTGNEIIDAIINEKAEEAKTDKIRIQVDGEFKGITIAAMDLCTIFSNLLDNAVEASKTVKEADREIIVSARKTGSFLFLTVENNTAYEVEISDRIKTTKSNDKDHGFGIGNVDKAVQKYGGEFRLDCKKAMENYVFMAEVMLPFENAEI